MSKMRALLVGATVAGAFAASSMAPAFATDTPLPAGGITVHSSDGGGNPQNGYLVLSGDGTVAPDGYLGVSGPDGGLVGCYDGEFVAGSANPIDPTATPNPNSECLP